MGILLMTRWELTEDRRLRVRGIYRSADEKAMLSGRLPDPCADLLSRIVPPWT